jgi:membrane fusion protein (multidrug efflux system)
MTRRHSLKIHFVLVLLASFTACSGPARQVEENGHREPDLPTVKVTLPSTDPLDIAITAPGSFVAFEEATISTETPGTVAEFRVKEGTRVRRGAVLVVLDKTKAELTVKQAEAALAQAQANFERAKSEIARKEILLEDRTISQGTFDTFKAQHDAASAAVDGADSTLALARQRLEDMTVVAPFGGVVKEKIASPGEFVGVGKALLVLIQIDPLKLQFEVPEKHAARLAVGQKVETSVTALPGTTFSGEIATVFPALAVESRTIHVEALLPNRDYKLIPGFYASVRVPLTPVPGALVIPRSALFRREGTENVFVLKGERAERVPVRVGGVADDRVEILSGLEPNDRLIVSGVDTLRAGDRVNAES